MSKPQSTIDAECSSCDGSGKYVQYDTDRRAFFDETCDECGGTGVVQMLCCTHAYENAEERCECGRPTGY